MSSIIDDPNDDVLVWDTFETSPKDNDVDTESDEADKEEFLGLDSENMPDEISDGELEDDPYNAVYDKKYYKISEVESILGETQYTIRFWEDSFAELGRDFCSQRSRGGTRRFTKKNIENLKLLKLLLRERRLTIEGAISEIKNERKRNVKERALILLQETRDELNSLIDAYNCILHQNS